MNLSTLHSRSASLDSFAPVLFSWRPGAVPSKQSVECSALQRRSARSGSRSICRPPVFWRLSWRVIFAVMALGYAASFGMAESAYTRGMKALDPVTVLWEFERAYRIFPFSQDFRAAPAQAAINFRQILPSQYVAAAIRRAIDQDPGAPDLIYNLRMIEGGGQ